MAKTWLRIARWRWIVIALGVVLPWTAVLFITWFMPPSPLRYETPQAGVVAVQYQEASRALEAGDLEAARTKLEALRQENPFNALIHAQLGAVHRRAGRLPEAIAATRMALGVDSRLGEAWYNLACDLLRMNQTEEALRHLRRAVEAGFDVRAHAKTDPDLATLREDQRLQVYLEGAASIPLSQRGATFFTEPPEPRVGEPFTLTLEVLALNQPPGGEPPAVAVSFRGPAESEVVAPLRIDSSFERKVYAGSERHRWLVRYRLVGRTPFAGRVGPWEVQLAGVVVPVESPLLVIEAPRPGSAGADGVFEGVPAFRPGVVFARPSSLPPPDPGPVTAELVPQGAGWSSGACVLTVSPLPPGGPDAVEARFESGLAPLAAYEVLYTVPGAAAPTGLRRVYAFAREVLPAVAKAPVTVRIGERRISVPIRGPSANPSANPAANPSAGP